MDALWSAATIKVIRPGLDDARVAEDISRLIGEHDVPVAPSTTVEAPATPSACAASASWARNTSAPYRAAPPCCSPPGPRPRASTFSRTTRKAVRRRAAAEAWPLPQSQRTTQPVDQPRRRWDDRADNASGPRLGSGHGARSARGAAFGRAAGPRCRPHCGRRLPPHRGRRGRRRRTPPPVFRSVDDWVDQYFTVVFARPSGAISAAATSGSNMPRPSSGLRRFGDPGRRCAWTRISGDGHVAHELSRPATGRAHRPAGHLRQVQSRSARANRGGPDATEGL
jgi:hypothetical protein